MNEHEIERIAAAMHAARPDWPAQQLRTLLREKLADKPRRDVFVALAWVACESGTASPYRVLETGPWWKAAGVEGASTGGRREWPDDAHRCRTCSLPKADCDRLWDDHPFEPAIQRPSEQTTKIVAALRDAKAVPVEHHPSHEPTTEGTEHVAPIRAALAAAKADTEETT